MLCKVSIYIILLLSVSGCVSTQSEGQQQLNLWKAVGYGSTHASMTLTGSLNEGDFPAVKQALEQFPDLKYGMQAGVDKTKMDWYLQSAVNGRVVDLKLVNYLIEQGADANCGKARGGQVKMIMCPLHQAISGISLYSSDTYDDTWNQQQASLLNKSVKSISTFDERVAVIELLIQKGADPKLKSYNATPLEFVMNATQLSEEKKVKLGRILMNAGAEIEPALAAAKKRISLLEKQLEYAESL